MVWLRSRTSLGSELPLSSGLYVDALPNATSFSGFAAFRSWPYTVSSDGDAEQIPGSRVTPSFFPVIGVRPMLGRAIADADAEVGAARVAVIGYDLWQRRFGGSPAVLGRRIELGNESFSIIGVMPRGFGFPRGAELLADYSSVRERRFGRRCRSRRRIGRTSERCRSPRSGVSSRARRPNRHGASCPWDFRDSSRRTRRSWISTISCSTCNSRPATTFAARSCSSWAL